MKTLLLSLLLGSASATYFVLETNPDCGDSGLAFDVDLSCASSGSSVCTFGDTATITGTMTVPETGAGNIVSLHNEACFMGIRTSYTCQEYDFETSLCGMFDLEQYGCPDAGEYDIEGDFSFPQNSGEVNLGGFWWSTSNAYVVIYSTITPLSEDEAEDASNYTCQTKVSVHKGDYSGSTYMIGFSTIMIVGLGALVHKKRRAAKIDLSKEERMLSDFERIDDSVRV